MDHHLTITKDCPGNKLCHVCEILQPGLFIYIEQHGKVNIKPWAASTQGDMLSRLVACCPYRAIIIRPVECENT